MRKLHSRGMKRNEEKTFLARIVFCHAHGPVDESKDDEHERGSPLPNEDADLKDCAVPTIMLCIVMFGASTG